MGKVMAQLSRGLWQRQRYRESDVEFGTAEYEVNIPQGKRKRCPQHCVSHRYPTIMLYFGWHITKTCHAVLHHR